MQRFKQAGVNTVETTIAEDGYDVVRLEQRDESFEDRGRVRFIKGGFSRRFDLCHDRFGMKTLLRRNLFQGCHLRDENAIRELQRFRELLLENRAPGGVERVG